MPPNLAPESLTEVPAPTLDTPLPPMATPPGLENYTPGPVLGVLMTAYNSEVWQTCGAACTSPYDPFITATGVWVRPGIVAVSRDLLAGPVPYGSKVQVLKVDASQPGCSGWLPGMPLDVQDTMHARKTNQLDLWLESKQDALLWGRCRATVQVFYARPS
jgi:3D (Asp-Asp-Asp) domain-containing protein